MSANEMTVEMLLRAHAPHAPESLRARVLALEPKERRLSLPPRRLVLVALPAAVGVAVSVAVIHGIVDSTPSKPTAVQQTLARPPIAHGSGTNVGAPPTWTTATQRSALLAPQHAVGSLKGAVDSSTFTPAVGSSARL